MKHVHVWSKGRIPGADGTQKRSGTPKVSQTLTSRSSTRSLPVRLSGPWGTKSLSTGAACIGRWAPPEGRPRPTTASRSSSRRGWWSAASAGCRRGWVPRMTGPKDQLRTGQTRTFSSLLGRCASGPTITVRAGRFSKSSFMRRYDPHKHNTRSFTAARRAELRVNSSAKSV